MWCHHFGKTPEEANKRAARQLLPVPVFRLGSQKSPWLVAADVLAAHIRWAARPSYEKVAEATAGIVISAADFARAPLGCRRSVHTITPAAAPT
ncbi:pyocin activator PrtN family protein [Stenotrophomonas terrae]|uniref:pyocin activator PrtN family protein n=1 Tax=Stenotrophomonas terrae TaxID=405446 RepID=UPI003D35B96A